MTPSTSSIQEHELLLAIARGEANWRELNRFGIEPGLDREPATWREPASIPTVQPSLHDLAVGLLTHLPSPPALREWAQVIEMTGCFDLTALDGDPGGETLLQAVWSASFGEPIDEGTLRVLRRIAERRHDDEPGSPAVDLPVATREAG
jgi:hypothetical protein